MLLWVAAGGFVAALGRPPDDDGGAVAAAAVFWFMPYTVYASRAFQPEPLLLLLMAAGLWAAVRHDERPDGRGLASPAGSAAPRPS